MRRLIVVAAVAVLVIVAAGATEAGRYRVAAAPQTCAGGSCGVATYTQPYQYQTPAAYVGSTPLYHPVYTVPAAPAPAPVYASPSSPPPVASPAGAPSALALVNQLRASYGRPPLSWDSTLAWYASRNNGVHAPGSNGGAGQCWAGVSDPAAAVAMWARSPAHLAIILSATTSVGVSPCPTGCTLNAR